MAKKAKVDFSLGITAQAEEETIDKDVQKKLKKFMKDLKELGVEISTAFLSGGHIRGGSIDLTEEEKATPDSNKE